MQKTVVQKQLNALYEAYLPKYLENTGEQVGISFPLFINVFEEYFALDTVKIMFVGKETYGWGGNISNLYNQPINDSLSIILKKYTEFAFGECENYWKTSAFWRFNFDVFRQIQALNAKNRKKFTANALYSKQGTLILQKLFDDSFCETDLKEIKLIISELGQVEENVDILTVANALKKKKVSVEEIVESLTKLLQFKDELLLAEVPKGLVWTNLSKIDLNNTAINDTLLRDTFDISLEILEQEIQILQPDLLFFIGDNPSYWKIFQRYFDVKESILEDNKDLYAVCSDKFPQKTKAFWTIHPQFKNSERLKKIRYDLNKNITQSES
jgi:hypothetical protein